MSQENSPLRNGALRRSHRDVFGDVVYDTARGLAPLRSFVLPGGSPAAAGLHLARTVTRRAERLLVALAGTPGEEVGGPALRYVNRLSDYLFVAARYANQKGKADILWVPGQSR